jgi:RND superfamily putative drug exporter
MGVRVFLKEKPQKMPNLKSVLIWISACLLVGALGLQLGLRSTIPGPNSTLSLERDAGEQIARSAGMPKKDTVAFLIGHPTKSVEEPEHIAAREELYSKLKSFKVRDHDRTVFSRVQTAGHTAFEDDFFISKDRRYVSVIAETTLLIDQSTEDLSEIPKLAAELKQHYSDFEFSYISNGTVNSEMFSLINRDLDRSLIFTLPITALILIWVFRSVVAAIVPLVIAGGSLIASLGVSVFVSHVLGPVSVMAAQLVVLLVLAIGIDYSLFFISRVREEVFRGSSYKVAVSVAQRTTGVAIFWSGLTVALSLVGLLLMQDTILASMGIVSIIAVVITVISTVVILPHLLRLLEPWILTKRSMRQARKDWSARILGILVRISTDFPVATVLLSGAVILALASVSKDLRLGTTVEPQMMPETMQTSFAFKELRAHYPDHAGIDLAVTLRAKNLSEMEEEGLLQDFVESLKEFPSVKGPLTIDWSDDRTVARYNFNIVGSANDAENEQLVSRLRSEIIPNKLSKISVEAGVGGTLIWEVDELNRYIKRTPIVFAAVLLLSIVFLLIAFRSLVIPVKAVILNLLSAGAAFGSLTYLFQGAIPAWNYGTIEGFVPALLFSILFGLSMDYHVFLLSRVQEEVVLGASTKKAVEIAIVETSGAITSAALIMISVFVVIAMLELPVMQQLGVGLAVAVLIDATLVRCLLLPATMVLLGTKNWYLPRWLKWLPQIRL